MTDRPLDLKSDEAQERLLRLFRYGQVGRCVSSVTHDLNNYLGVVLAYSELVALDSAISEDSRRMIEEAAKSIRVCAKLLGTLTSVARKERADVRVIDVSATLADLLDLKRYEFRVALVDLDVQFETGMPSMLVDYPRFAMAFLHLVMNTLEALDGISKPRARISLRKEGESIVIETWNSGPVVDEGVRERIFEPFYTTKSGGHVGLGLAVARDSARYHNGDVTYDPGRGFIMTLPFATGLSPE